MYSPAATNVPVFTKKGDSKLAAFYSNSSFGGRDVKNLYSYGFDAQAAYAINNHWLVLLNQSSRYEKTSGDIDTYYIDSNSIRYKRSITEIGGGYFTAIRDSSKLYVQITGGIGFGKFTLDDAGKDATTGYYSRYHQAGVTKLFIQPALQLLYNKNFSSSFVSRFVILWYHSIKTNYTAAEQDVYLLDGLTSSPRTFWEPAIINNFSFNKLPALQFELQFGFAALISRRFIDYRAVNISAGAVVNIAKLKKHIK
ncbi:MAG: hypothetical protein WBP16_11030 [Ferruginibacter sp.]